MAKKNYNYAQLEAVAQEMRANPDMVFYYEYQTPTATLPTGEVLDLVKEFGEIRTSGQGWPIDVLWIDGAGRSRGMAGQHTDVGMEALYAQLPGIKVVAPSNAYDAKGLLITALRDPDPVVYLDYG